MKHILTLIVSLCLTFSITSQNLEVDGKMVVKDINTIATFQSTVKNSFIRFATNDDPLRGTNIGYFDNEGEVGTDPDDYFKYFFIDTPTEGFGELIIRNGKVSIGTLSSSAKLNIETPNGTGLEVRAKGSPGGNAAGIFSASSGGNGVFAISTTNAGIYGSGGKNSLDEQQPDFYAAHNSYSGPSSRRWKNNIQNITTPIEKLSEIRGVTFDWDEEHGGSNAVGFIAEEVGKVYPEVVFYEENGVDAKGMDYIKMTPLLVEAANAMRAEYQEKFNAQDKEIQSLKEELALIKELISGKSVSKSDQ